MNFFHSAHMIISKIKKILLSFIFHTKNIWYIMCFSWFFHMYELIVAFKKFTIWKHIFYSFSKHIMWKIQKITLFSIFLCSPKRSDWNPSLLFYLWLDLNNTKQYWHFFIIHYNYVPRYLLLSTIFPRASIFCCSTRRLDTKAYRLLTYFYYCKILHNLAAWIYC